MDNLRTTQFQSDALDFIFSNIFSRIFVIQRFLKLYALPVQGMER